jgi:hypothetical protein
MMDNKIIQVALDGLDNILKVGEIDKQTAGPGAVNQYALYVEEAMGMVTIHNLQQHDNLEIYKKAFNIMDKYFPDDEDVDAGISATHVDSTGAFAVRITVSLYFFLSETPVLLSSTATCPHPKVGSASEEHSRLLVLCGVLCQFVLQFWVLFIHNPTSPTTLHVPRSYSAHAKLVVRLPGLFLNVYARFFDVYGNMSIAD